MTALGPALPANWYLLGPSSGLKPGSVRSFDIGGTPIVLWRTASGLAQAFGGHCVHMGCHLGGARVMGDALRCPLHHRMIGADGAFRPGGEAALTQPVFTVREHLSCLFIAMGAVGSERPVEIDRTVFATRYAGEHVFPLDWQVLVANGFDVEHLASVHERRLVETPDLTELGQNRIRLRYRTRPTGTSLGDRVIGWLAPDGVRGTITCFSGTTMLVESALGRWQSFILLSFVPGSDGSTTIRGIVGVKAPSRWWGWLAAGIASLLFKSFLAKDLGVLDKLQWHEPAPSLALGDRLTRQLCDYFRALADA